MMDRVKEPAFGKIDTIDLMEPTVQHLSNGLPVFSINAGEQDVLKIELVFGAGTSTPDKILVGSSAINLMKEGTSKRTAAEIAEAVDYYGSYIQTEIAHEECSLSLYTLNKHLAHTLPTLAEVYSLANYPEREFETYVLSKQQELMVNEQKVGYLCSKAFSASLFGGDHPYGRSAKLEDYQALKREDLVAFHNAHVKDKISYIIVSGKIAPDTFLRLEEFFGKDARQSQPERPLNFVEVEAKTVHVPKEDAVQNAIRIGRVLFNRTHPDFTGMQILATVLGGYFGSRLMSNIREDKGYTYGISAGIVSLKRGGYLSISTEVGANVCQATLNEIYIEIERLRRDLIPNDELDLVRNYMLGSVLKSIDGPFQVAGKWKSYLKYGLSMETHHALIHQIKTITPERLRELAQTYLQREDLKQVTAGQPLQ